MPENVNTIVQNIKEKWSALDSKIQRRVVLLSILGLIAVGIMTAVLTTTEYTVLYTGLDISESAEVLSLLQDLNIRAQTRDGGTILVEKSQEENARMQLSMQGYPKSGLNYDLYLNSISMTSSTQDKNILLVYQLQDRLRSTIRSLQGVKDAIVTISIDTDDTFRFGSESKPVSANVVLSLDGNFRPSQDQIFAVEKLMLTSISGLRAENLAIIDSNLNNLLPAAREDALGTLTSTQRSFKNQIEEELGDKIRYLFDPVFGANNFKVAVSTIIDFDRTASERIEYSPVIDDEGIAVIIEEMTEIYEDSTTNQGAGSDSLNERVQTVVNYRVNELRETVERAQGTIEDISISLLINDPELGVAELEDIRRVAAAAVGVEVISINASVMDFTAQQELEQQIADALALAEIEETEFPLSERALIGIVAAVLAFVFTLIAFISIRRGRAKQSGEIVVSAGGQAALTQQPRERSREELTEQVLQAAMEKQRLEQDQEKSREEQVIRKEIQKIVETSPKNAADIISYWLESKDTKQNPFPEDIIDE
jgi:flagellar M-ring protein FliF